MQKIHVRVNNCVICFGFMQCAGLNDATPEPKQLRGRRSMAVERGSPEFVVSEAMMSCVSLYCEVVFVAGL